VHPVEEKTWKKRGKKELIEIIAGSLNG